MTWKTFLNNGRLGQWRNAYLTGLKKCRGAAILYSGLLVLCMPVVLLFYLATESRQMQFTQYAAQSISTGASSTFQILCVALVLPLALIFVAVFGASLFGYMHSQRSVDLYHSLPLRRECLLLGRFCSGLTALLAPLVLCFGLSAAGAAFYGVDAGFYTAFLLPGFFYLVLAVVSCFSMVMFLCVCSGTLMNAVISTVVVSAAYPLTVFLGNSVLAQLLPGWNNTLNITLTSALSPFLAAFLPHLYWDSSAAGPYTDVPLSCLLWWVVFSAFLIFASGYVFRRRKSEYAQSPFAFPKVKTVTRFLATAAFGMGFGFIMFSIYNSDAAFLVFTLLAGFAMHSVAEALYSKGFKNYARSLPAYFVFAAAFLVFYFSAAFGFFGFDQKLPQQQYVDYVSLQCDTNLYLVSEYDKDTNSASSYTSSYGYMSGVRVYTESGRLLDTLPPTLTTQQGIADAIDLHSRLLACARQQYPYRMSDTTYGTDFTLQYKLKSGTVFSRKYTVNLSNLPAQLRSELLQASNAITCTADFRDECLPYQIGAQAISYVSIDISDPSLIPEQFRGKSLYNAKFSMQANDENGIYCTLDHLTAAQKETLWNLYLEEIDAVDFSKEELWLQNTSVFISSGGDSNFFDVPPSGVLRDIAGSHNRVILRENNALLIYGSMTRTLDYLLSLCMQENAS